jgi:predicted permease
MDALLQDLRYSVRRLSRSPGFAIVAVLTLALGIGANAAIFSLVNALLLKPTAGVREPERVVAVFTSDFSSSQYSASSYPDFEEFRAQTNVFSDVAAITNSPVNIVRGEQVERFDAEVVTPSYFALLGVRAAAGRLFTEADAAATSTPVIVISHDVWQERYGGNRELIGSTVQVNGRPFAVIGVAAPRFHGMSSGERRDAWLPLPHATHVVGEPTARRGDRGLMVFARLAPGVTVAAAQARFTTLQQHLFETYPAEWTNSRGTSRLITVMTEREARVPPDQRGAVFTVTGVLLGAVAFVLLICCANVANLLLARATARRREVAIRYSLGARRATVLRQLLVESTLIAAVGGAAGLILSIWSTDLLLALQAGADRPLFLDLSLDGRVLLFTLVIAAMTAVIFGLAPALDSTRADLGGVLKTERTLSASSRGHLRDVLVAGQIALALVLAVAAGLLARTLQKASEVDIGVDTEGVVVAGMDLRTQGYDSERMRQFYDELRTQLEARPEVAAVTYAQRVPIAQPFGRRGAQVVGYTPDAGEDMEFAFNVVAPNYFTTMRLPIVDGRVFTDVDRAGAPRVAIVNETFARRFWPDRSAVGQHIRMGNAGPIEIVGVARDGKYWSVAEAPRSYFYLPAAQENASLILHVRAARGGMAAVQRLVREAVRSLDPLLPILRLDTMERQIAGSMVTQRAAGALVGVFAVLAVLLAAIGIYGVTTVLVVQRVPEIGLRVALGATSSSVVRMVVGRALAVAGVGIAAGLGLAALGGRVLESMLFGVGRFDPPSFVIAAAVVGFAACVASYLPARRAARVHPLRALSM